MRLFDGQVHVLEIAGVLVVSFFAYAMGYSLPLFALLIMALWPLFLVQLVFEGLAAALFLGLRRVFRMRRPAKPKPPVAPTPKRRGVARYIWFVPLIMVTAGYGRFVHETGEWFL